MDLPALWTIPFFCTDSPDCRRNGLAHTERVMAYDSGAWHGWIAARATRPAGEIYLLRDKQKVQMLQRDRATLHVTEHFAKSIRIASRDIKA